jgi:hypothetical protein
MASFLTADEFIKRYDVRRTCELLSDTGTPVSAGSLSSNTNLEALLGEATEMVLSAAAVAEEYSETELQTLADSTTSGFLLRRLVADLTFGLLVSRRATSAADMDRLAPQWKFAQYHLQQIADGVRIFPRISGGEHEDAGNPRTADLTQQTTTPTDSWAAQATSRLLPSSGRINFYPPA